MPRPPSPPFRFSSPDFVDLAEALEDVEFPLSKRELMDALEGQTALVGGRNVDLRELIKDLDDDAFDSEEELLDAVARSVGYVDADERPTPPKAGA